MQCCAHMWVDQCEKCCGNKGHECEQCFQWLLRDSLGHALRVAEAGEICRAECRFASLDLFKDIQDVGARDWKMAST